MRADGLFGYLPNKAIQSTASHFLRIKVMVGRGNFRDI